MIIIKGGKAACLKDCKSSSMTQQRCLPAPGIAISLHFLHFLTNYVFVDFDVLLIKTPVGDFEFEHFDEAGYPGGRPVL
jgi:hypothetical protein